MTEFFVCLGRDGALRLWTPQRGVPTSEEFCRAPCSPILATFSGSAAAPLSSEALAKAEAAPVGVSPTESTIRVGSPFG